MSDEASNVATLKEAYRMWRETKGGSVDHWMGICDENIQFGSIVQGAPRVAYMTEYKARDELAQYFEGLKRDWEMLEFKTDHFVAQGDRVVMLGSLLMARQTHRQGGLDAEGGFLAFRERQSGRILRIFRYRSGARGDGVSKAPDGRA